MGGMWSRRPWLSPRADETTGAPAHGKPISAATEIAGVNPGSAQIFKIVKG